MPFAKFQGQDKLDIAYAGDPLKNPSGYRASAELARAVNVAVALQRPLLVTGDPGTGKTQLAFRIAAELKLGEVLRFNTKSSSVASDLFYQFDRLRQFAQAQLNALRDKDAPPAHEFVQPQALGRAILETLDPQQVRRLLGQASHAAPRSALVLIDEIDKAPRDFPNDLLNQIEEREFHIPEIGAEAHFKAERPLVVVITSNSERQLPEAFLRRCVYHHIDFPANPLELQKVLGARLESLNLPTPTLTEALRQFFAWREDKAFSRAPSTSELLDWLLALQANGLQPGKKLADQAEVLLDSLGSLYKTSDDLAHGRKLLSPAKA
jgi:MoxR-like ATPase